MTRVRQLLPLHDASERERESDGKSEGKASGRRPYHPPVLRYLGALRDMTFGSAVGMIEGAGTFRGM
jgi:hypothetical protein